MEIAKLVLEYIKALLWPVVTVTLFIIFRGQISEILKRMTSLDVAGFAAAFEAQTKETLEESRASVPPEQPEEQADEEAAAEEPADADSNPPEPAHDEPTGPRRLVFVPTGAFARIKREAETRPALAITSSWETMEQTLLSAIAQCGVTYDVRQHGLPWMFIYKQLLAVQMDRSGLDTLRDLRDLRNAAQHYGPVTSSAAVNFVESCLNFSLRAVAVLQEA